MKNRFFFLFCFLAIFSIICFKFKYFNSIIEGAATCDPNKPLVYGKKSAKTCQNLRESQNDDNLKTFKYGLSDLKKEVKKLWKTHKNILNKHNEMNGHISETVKSLNCKEIKIPPLFVYFLMCGEPAEKDKNDKPEVDINNVKRNQDVSGSIKRNIGGMEL
jgi:hypothetical protein